MFCEKYPSVLQNVPLKHIEMMKTLIVGATGTFARPVIQHLDKNGYELKLLSRTIDPSLFDNKFETVKGDLFNPGELSRAMNGCEAVHINLAKLDEALATEAIVKVALQQNIKLISLISGSTVCEKNRWFEMIDKKFRAEQAVINSGIPYLIFRPSWFFESLPMMIRDGKAMMIGKKPGEYRWIAGDDYGRIVAIAYTTPETYNRIFQLYGPESYRMNKLLESYRALKHPEIKKVSTIPLGMMKLIGTLSGKKEMKAAAALFGYFEKVREPGGVEDTEALLGKAEMNFEKWIASLTD